MYLPAALRNENRNCFLGENEKRNSLVDTNKTQLFQNPKSIRNERNRKMHQSKLIKKSKLIGLKKFIHFPTLYQKKKGEEEEQKLVNTINILFHRISCRGMEILNTPSFLSETRKLKLRLKFSSLANKKDKKEL